MLLQEQPSSPGTTKSKVEEIFDFRKRGGDLEEPVNDRFGCLFASTPVDLR
jgi:hypothetical protein